MRKRQPFLLLTLLGAIISMGLPVLGHAQTIGWVDRIFTFREDQRPAVSGSRRATPPNYVTQPSYNPTDHVQWSQFYTNPQLQAQDAMVGSASKVMRTPAPNMPSAEFDAIAGQALQNARASRPANLQIGEPGEGAGMQAGGGKVARGTQVGAPVNNWQDAADPRLTSRPGDYDFERSQASNSQSNNMGAGEVLTETAPKFSLPVIVPADSGPLEGSSDKPTSYTVQRGDSLGSIAARAEIYNEAALWPLIYSANRAAIGRSPHAIAPKQELTIPRDYTEAQAKKARARGGQR